MALIKIEEDKLRAMMEEVEAVEKFDVVNREYMKDFNAQMKTLQQNVDAMHPEVAIKRAEWEAKVKAKKEIFK